MSDIMSKTTTEPQTADTAPVADPVQDPTLAPVVVTVCTTCRQADTDPEAIRPGLVLAETLNAADLPSNVSLRGTECLSACSRGCALVIEGGEERWSYIYGDLDPASHSADILAGIHAYAATTDGLVPWRARPVVFRKQSVARIPPKSHASVELSKAAPTLSSTKPKDT